MTQQLEGKRCLVTGGGSGIGRAIATRYAAEGASVVVAGRREERLTETAEASERISTCAGDLAVPECAERAVNAVVERHGGLDIVCHAAGILRRNEVLAETTDDEWALDIAVNLTATFLACRAAIPHLTTSKGSLILVGSQLAHIGLPGYATYSATKGGVLSMMRALAVDLGPRGVRVNALSPGVVETEMAYIGRDFSEIRDQVAGMLPLRRVGQPEDMAGPAVFLASDDSAWMTGQSLVIDGGFTAQ